MRDIVFGRDLPPMKDWTRAQLQDAMDNAVQFGLVVLGQGLVTGEMLRFAHRAQIATFRITHDPRDKLVGAEYTTEMRYVREIRHPANQFSLMQPPTPAQTAPPESDAVAKARAMLEQAKAQAEMRRALRQVQQSG